MISFQKYTIATFGILLLWALGFSSMADIVTDQKGESGRINDPVKDAKRSYNNGVKEFVGIALEDEVLLVGISPDKEAAIRKKYRVRAINKRWESFNNIENDSRRFYKLKRYANRYNLMMLKLIEQEQPKKKQYRY